MSRDAIDIKVLQTLSPERKPHFFVARGPVPRERSIQPKNVAVTVARGPVPRDLSAETRNVRNPEATDVCYQDLRTARDRPSPYVPGGDCLFLTVARGPVPRERSIQPKNIAWNVARGPVPRDLSAKTRDIRSPEATDVCYQDLRTARDRPSPYGEGGRLDLSQGTGVGVGEISRSRCTSQGRLDAGRRTGSRPTVKQTVPL